MASLTPICAGLAGSKTENLLKPAEVDEFRREIRDRTVEITSQNSQKFHWFAYILLIFAPLLPLIITWASPMAWNPGASLVSLDGFGFFPPILKAGYLAQTLLILLYCLFGAAFAAPEFARELGHEISKVCT